MGTFWKTLVQAKKDANKKTRCYYFQYVIIKEKRGFWVVSLGWLKGTEYGRN